MRLADYESVQSELRSKRFYGLNAFRRSVFVHAYEKKAGLVVFISSTIVAVPLLIGNAALRIRMLRYTLMSGQL